MGTRGAVGRSTSQPNVLKRPSTKHLLTLRGAKGSLDFLIEINEKGEVVNTYVLPRPVDEMKEEMQGFIDRSKKEIDEISDKRNLHLEKIKEKNYEHIL